MPCFKLTHATYCVRLSVKIRKNISINLTLILNRFLNQDVKVINLSSNTVMNRWSGSNKPWVSNLKTIKLSGKHRACIIQCMVCITMIINQLLMTTYHCFKKTTMMSILMGMSIFKTMHTIQITPLLVRLNLRIMMKNSNQTWVTMTAGATKNGSQKGVKLNLIEKSHLSRENLLIKWPLDPLESIPMTCVKVSMQRLREISNMLRTLSTDLLSSTLQLRSSMWSIRVLSITIQLLIHSSKSLSWIKLVWTKFCQINWTRRFTTKKTRSLDLEKERSNNFLKFRFKRSKLRSKRFLCLQSVRCFCFQDSRTILSPLKEWSFCNENQINQISFYIFF